MDQYEQHQTGATVHIRSLLAFPVVAPTALPTCEIPPMSATQTTSCGTPVESAGGTYKLSLVNALPFDSWHPTIKLITAPDAGHLPKPAVVDPFKSRSAPVHTHQFAGQAAAVLSHEAANLLLLILITLPLIVLVHWPAVLRTIAPGRPSPHTRVVEELIAAIVAEI